MKSIFVSSTFKDMQAERNLIRFKVTPEINKFLKEYEESIEFTDLRWGIDTTDSINASPEKIKEGEAVEITPIYVTVHDLEVFDKKTATKYCKCAKKILGHLSAKYPENEAVKECIESIEKTNEEVMYKDLLKDSNF